MLSFFKIASDEFYGNEKQPGLLAAQQHIIDAGLPSPEFGPPSTASQNPLLNKQAIIVLREELEYFAIPPKSTKGDAADISTERLVDVKRRSGKWLMERKNIFSALQRNVQKENNVAEQHLIDMLCMRSVDSSEYVLGPSFDFMYQWF